MEHNVIAVLLRARAADQQRKAGRLHAMGEMTLVDLEYERVPCAQCGAVSVDDAETKCRTMRDETGEDTCPAANEDEAGFFTQPTPAPREPGGAGCRDRRGSEAPGLRLKA